MYLSLNRFMVSRSQFRFEPETRNQKPENSLSSLPRTHHALEPLKQPGAEDPENTEGDRATEHLLHQKQLIRFPEQKSESRLGGFDLGDENQNQRRAGSKPKASEDIGQG